MSTSIQDVRGIGPSTAAILAEHNIVTAEDLAACKTGQVAAVKGFSDTRAKQVIAAAKTLTAAPSAAKKEKTKADKKKADKTKKPKSKAGKGKKKDKADNKDKKDKKGEKDKKKKTKKAKKK